jgi:hypothetical protein
MARFNIQDKPTLIMSASTDAALTYIRKTQADGKTAGLNRLVAYEARRRYLNVRGFVELFQANPKRLALVTEGKEDKDELEQLSFIMAGAGFELKDVANLDGPALKLIKAYESKLSDEYNGFIAGMMVRPGSLDDMKGKIDTPDMSKAPPLHPVVQWKDEFVLPKREYKGAETYFKALTVDQRLLFGHVFAYIVEQRFKAINDIHKVLMESKTEDFDIGGDDSHYDFSKFIAGTGTTKDDIVALTDPTNSGHQAASTKIKALVARWQVDGSEEMDFAFIVGIMDP